MFYQLNSIISSVIWGPPMLAVFLGTGLYLSAKTGFFQIFGVKQWTKLTVIDAYKKRKEPPKTDGSVSQFAALTSALAACLAMVMMILIGEISDLFQLIKTTFGL